MQQNALRFMNFAQLGQIAPPQSERMPVTIWERGITLRVAACTDVPSGLPFEPQQGVINGERNREVVQR